jgi:hypothetical protein
MISTARSFGGVTSSSEPIRFDISSAEELEGIANSSIDLITAATAAHWFDMSRFWPRAAAVLRPGGTVAIWTMGGTFSVHPSLPNATAIQAAIISNHERNLKPFSEPGHVLVENLYRSLPLPWSLATPVLEFDESTYFRKEWGTATNAEFFVGKQAVDMDTLEKLMGSMSQVTRWRQAHPDAVGTERDVAKMLRREIERLLHEAGVEEGKEVIKGNVGGVLMMVKKKAS